MCSLDATGKNVGMCNLEATGKMLAVLYVQLGCNRENAGSMVCVTWMQQGKCWQYCMCNLDATGEMLVCVTWDVVGAGLNPCRDLWGMMG